MKKPWRFILIWAGIVLIIYLGIRFLAPIVLPPPKPKYTQPSPVRYRYFQVIDEATGKTLTFISSAPVTIGDEYITAENRRYVVVRVKGNKAYARYAGRAK